METDGVSEETSRGVGEPYVSVRKQRRLRLRLQGKRMDGAFEGTQGPV